MIGLIFTLSILLSLTCKHCKDLWPCWSHLNHTEFILPKTSLSVLMVILRKLDIGCCVLALQSIQLLIETLHLLLQLIILLCNEVITCFLQQLSENEPCCKWLNHNKWIHLPQNLKLNQRQIDPCITKANVHLSRSSLDLSFSCSLSNKLNMLINIS